MATRNKKNESLNVIDLIPYLAGYWYWFLVSVMICVSVAFYIYHKKPYVYRSDMTVIIKDPSNSKTTVSLGKYDNMINNVNVANEILQFQSKTLMAEVVRRLDANVNYQQVIRLRTIELYDFSPIKLSYESEKELVSPLSFSVKVLNDKEILLNERKYVLGDTLSVGDGKVCLTSTPAYEKKWDGQEITATVVPVSAAASMFQSRLMIAQAESDATILDLSMMDYSRNRAKDILNTVVKVYNEMAIADKNMVAVNTSQFINERLAAIEDELGSVESQLASYKSSNRIMSAEESATKFLEESRENNAVAEDLETKVRVLNYIKQYISDPANANELLPVNTGLDDISVENQINQYNTTKLRRDRLLEDSSMDNPTVKDLTQSLEGLKNTISRSIDNLIKSMNVKIDDARRQEAHSVSQFSAMPVKARQVLSIERKQKIKEELYMFLLNRREENALAQAMVDNNARIINEAEVPWSPIYPNRNKMLLLALLTGLAVPSIMLLVKLFLDNNVRSRAEIDDIVTAPFVGEIPKMDRKQRKISERQPVVYSSSSLSLFSESFRSVYTNIGFMRPASDCGTVVSLVSFMANSGKTFITSNLAACFADAHKKILIVDADLRKRHMSEKFNFKHQTLGLSNYLSDGSLTIEDILKQNVLEGVDLIPAGSIPPNPVELLSRQRLDDMMETLKHRYDCILVDSVPVNIVADSVVINRVVDIHLFVLRCGLMDRRLLPMLEEYYKSGTYSNVCILLNGADTKHSYGQYGYAYGYGSGYGYGEDGKRSRRRHGHRRSRRH